MTDYDLGRAKGKIVIDVDDRGYRKAERANESLAETTHRVADGFDDAAESQGDLEKEQRKAVGTTKEESKALDELNKISREQKKITDEVKQSKKELNKVLEDEKSTEAEIEQAINRSNKARAEALKLAQDRKRAELSLANAMKGTSGTSRRGTTKLKVDDTEANLKIRKFKQNLDSIKKNHVVRIVTETTQKGNKTAGIAAGGSALATGGAGVVGLAGSGTVGLGAQAIVGIADSAAELSGVLGLIPGVVAGIGTVSATLKIATQGFGDAFEAVLSGDVEKLNAALEEMAPAAQAIFEAMAPLSSVIKEAGQGIQEAFSHDLAQYVKPLAEIYLPLVSGGMVEISKSLNEGIQEFLRWAGEASVAQDVAGFLTNVNEALVIMRPVATLVGQIIQDIVSVSGSFLPQLAQIILNITTEVRDWINEMRETGKMAEWIQTGIDAFKQLWEIIKTFGSAFGDIFDIGKMFGGGALDWLQKLGDAFKTFTSSEAGTSAIATFFGSTAKAADAFIPVLGQIMNAFMELFPLLSDVGVAMAPGIGDFFDGLASTFNVLKPIMVQMAKPMSDIFTSLGQWLPAIFQTGKTQLPEIMQSLADAIEMILKNSPDVMSALLTGINDFLKVLPGVIDDVMQILPPLIQAFSIIKTLSMFVIGVITQTIVYIGELLNAIIKFFDWLINTMPTAVGQWLASLGPMITDALSTAWEAIKGWFSSFISWVGSVASGVWESMKNAWNSVVAWITEFGGSVRNSLNELIATFVQWATDLGAWFLSLPAKISAWAAEIWKSFLDFLGGIASTIGDGAQIVWGAITEFGNNIWNKIKEIAANAVDWGASIVQGLIDGIKSMIGKVGDAIGDVAQTIQDFIMGRSPTKKGPLSGRGWTYYSGQRVASAFAEGIADNAHEAGDAAGAMAQYGSDGASSLEGFVKDMTEFTALGSSMISFIQGISDIAFNVIDLFTHDFMTGESNLPKTWTKDPNAEKKGGTRADATPSERRRDKSTFDWDAVAEKESGGKWSDNNSGGHMTSSGAPRGGLQITDGTWVAFGGKEFANNAAEATKAQQIAIAERIAFEGFGDTKPQGLGAWEVITKGLVDGVNENTKRNQTPGLSTETSSAFDKELLANVPMGKYSQEGSADLTKGLGDCTSAVEDLVNMMDGKPTGGRKLNTGNAAELLPQMGFIKGEGGLGDMRIAFNEGHMQATLPGGTNFNWGSQAAAARGGRTGTGADDPALDQRYYRPQTDDALNRVADGQDDQLAYDELMVQELRTQNTTLNDQLTAYENGTASDDDITTMLNGMDQQILDLKKSGTPEDKERATALEGLQGDVATDRGFQANDPQDMISQVQGIANGASSIAQSVVGAIDAGIKAIGNASELTSTLVRGIENTEDVGKIIDNIQSFVDFASKIAGTVASVASTVGSLISAGAGADPSGGASGAAAAVQGVAAIAGIVQGVLDTVNAAIDMGQEVARIAGKYFSQFLSRSILGGLEGDIKMLLDQNDWTLKAWSEDNPDDKRQFNVPAWMRGTDEVQEQGGKIRDLNMYIGPGTDPAESMNQGMWAVMTDQGGVFSSEF
jgi:phage-related protein